MEPLRFSAVLKQIDISIIGQHERTLIKPEPLTTQERVLPIIDDMIAGVDATTLIYGTVLSHLHLPEKWCKNCTLELDRFLHGYNQLRFNRQPSCSNCDGDDSNFGQMGG